MEDKSGKIPHKKIYGAENDVIDTVVQNVKRDSARRQNGGSASAASKNQKPRRADSSRKYTPSFGSKVSRKFTAVEAWFRKARFPLIGIVVVLIICFSLIVETRNFTVDEQNIILYGLSSDVQGYRILHLSDLNSINYGDEQAQLMRTVKTLSYDMVILTGDMVGAGNDPEQLYKLLEALPSSVPVYFIAGDSDPGPMVDRARDISGSLDQIVLADWILGAQERGAIYVDRPTKVTIGNTIIWLTPCDMLTTDLTEARSGFRSAEEQQEDGVYSGIQVDYDTLPFTTYRTTLYEESYKTALTMQDSELHISLAHIPPSSDYISAVQNGMADVSDDTVQLTKPDLILAGHYCNGVIKIPFIGTTLHVSSETLPRYGWFPAADQVSGLTTFGDIQMYVTGGLGTNSDTPYLVARIGNRPVVSLLTLSSESPTSMLED